VIGVCGDLLRTCDKGEPADWKWLPIEA
jgi:hypothetical protein